MISSTEAYIAAHREAQEYIHKHPDVKPAYDYLKKKWQRWNENHAKLPEAEATAKLEKLFAGLTDYFLYANPVQEELVEISAQASRKVLLAESLLVTLDQNPDIKDAHTLKQEIDKVISIIRYRKSNGNDPAYKAVPPELLKAVLATQEATDEHSKIAASVKLRKQIQNWVMKDFAFDRLDEYDEAIVEFGRSRQKRTEELNRYQTDLIKLQNSLYSLNGREWQHTIDDTELVVHRLLDAVSDRIAEVEDFRNGLITELKHQAEILTNCVITSPRIRNGLPAHFLRQDSVGNILLTVRDLPQLFNNINNPTHPLVNNMDSQNQRLSMLATNSHNPIYSREHGEIRINDSGIKSWKRTIDKLEQQHYRWLNVKDLSRVNIVFNNSASMFFYNRVLRDVAASHGWHISPIHAKDNNQDRGLIMQQSGSMHWIIHMRKTSANGRVQMCEVKLDDISQYKAEYISHKIYECARLLQGNIHQLDFNQITPERYEEFRRYSLRTIATVLTHPELVSPALEKRLRHISALLDTEAGSEIAGTIYKALIDAHIVSCASAAKRASPSMAALYNHKFREMVDKDPKTKAEKMRIYEETGPKPISPSDPMLGHFKEHHKSMCEGLIKEWETSWPMHAQQRAR